MKLITENIEDVEYITEGSGTAKNHFIQGIFLEGNVKNRNGRVYPEHVLDKEAGRYIKEMIGAKRAFGELGHPAGPSVNLDRVSHIITEMSKDGGNYLGKAKLTDTPMGNIARGLLESGGKIGVSSRGLGSLKTIKDGIMEVQDDYRLATVDIVHDPSAPSAFVEGILENVEWLFDPIKDQWIAEELDNIQKSVRKMSKREMEEQTLSLFENYMKILTVKNV